MVEEERELSVVVPAYNEAGNIAEVLENAVRSLDASAIDFEINVVNDGSDDSTGRILEELRAANRRVRVLTHNCNRGYGAALRSGMAAATGTHVLVSDGDGQFQMDQFQAIWRRRHDADMVLGYRDPRKDPLHRRVAGWIYNHAVVPLFFGVRLRDVNCGFKLISRRVIADLRLRSTGALISAELLAAAKRRGATHVEVGVKHFPRRSGRATGLMLRVVLKALRELPATCASVLRQTAV